MSEETRPEGGRAELVRRLTSYWKLEAWNVLLVPAFLIFMAYSAGGRIGWLSLVPLAAMMLLLVIGALYWRAKLQRLQAGRSMEPALRWIAALQKPSLALSLVAVLLAVMGWLVPDLSAGLADRWVATAAAILALLEYVNYYHRQLQHFDRVSDWNRLKAGRGFRVSQMRQDLDRLNRGQRV